MFVPCLVPFLIMLLTPKLIGVLDTIRKRRLDWAEARSFALEVPFSLLLAPLLIYLHHLRAGDTAGPGDTVDQPLAQSG